MNISERNLNKREMDMDTKIKEFDDMSEAYRNAYKAFDAAVDEMITVIDCMDYSRLTLETGFLKSRIRDLAGEAIDKFSRKVPMILSSMENPDIEKQKISEIERVTDTLRGLLNEYGKAVLVVSRERFNDIRDKDAMQFEVGALVCQTKNLIKVAISVEHIATGNLNPVTKAFGFSVTGIDDSYERIDKWLSEKGGFMSAQCDFTEGDDTDDLPESLYEELNTVCVVNDILMFINALGFSFGKLSKASDDLNVYNIRKLLGMLISLLNRRNLPGDRIFQKITDLESRDDLSEEEKELIRAREDALEELDDIYNNKDNFTGLHVNHVVSGNTEFVVWAKKITDELDENGNPVYQLDDFGPYATKKDAENAAEKLEGYSEWMVFENPTDEFYTVIRNEDGKEDVCCKMESEDFAYAFLYALAKPESFVQYLELRNKKAENNI